MSGGTQHKLCCVRHVVEHNQMWSLFHLFYIVNGVEGKDGKFTSVHISEIQIIWDFSP